jgi:ribosome-associated protein
MEHFLAVAKEAMDEKKGLDPVILDLKGISGVTDYFIICSGRTPVQVRAIVDNILIRMKDAGYVLPPKEGYQDGHWILLDYGNLVIHVLLETVREFYKLESLWHDAPQVALNQ